MAMMPHPERTENGDLIFSSMKEFIEMSNPVTQHLLTSDQSQIELRDYAVNSSYTQWMVNLIITDNEASSVQRVLKQLGITGLPITNVENACSSSSSAFRQAYISVAAGVYDVVLVLGVEKLTKFGGGTLPLEKEDFEAHFILGFQSS